MRAVRVNPSCVKASVFESPKFVKSLEMLVATKVRTNGSKFYHFRQNDRHPQCSILCTRYSLDKYKLISRQISDKSANSERNVLLWFLERTCAEHIVWNFYATPSARLANKTFQIVSSEERIAYSTWIPAISSPTYISVGCLDIFY